MEKANFKSVWVSTFLCLAVLFGIFLMVLRNGQKVIKEKQQEIAQMKEEFQQEILMAMRATSDPCADVFF